MSYFAIKINRLVVDEAKGIVMGEMDIEFGTRQQVKKKLSEAFIQVWKENKLSCQRFYYKEIVNAA